MRWESSTTQEGTEAQVGPETSPADAVRVKPRPARAKEVLVVNRDPELRIFLNKALFAGNVSYTTVASPTEADACLRKGAYGAVIVGIDCSESLEFVSRSRRDFPSVPLVAVARTTTADLVRDVLKAGAADFLFGSMDVRSFAPRVQEVMEGVAAARSTEPAPRARKAASSEGSASPEVANDSTNAIVCKNKRMQRILEIAETIAPTDSTALIQGESGTGKELIARRIHALSKRCDKPFVEVNCGALPETLLESQLFGHEKGSFTGAVHRQVGLFEIADGGTIFLDEVGEMSLDMQVKLLRVLQFQEFRRIGGSQVVRVDVRVIAATNKDLAEEVAAKRFRPDLFYRLNVISLGIPPLRERLEEVPELVERFGARFARERGLARKHFSAEAIDRLQKCRWTGNVRELENAVERSILLSKGEQVEAADLEEFLGAHADVEPQSAFAPTLTLDEVKRIHIGNVLAQNGGNKMRTARLLKINVKTLYNLMKRLDIKESTP